MVEQSVVMIRRWWRERRQEPPVDPDALDPLPIPDLDKLVPVTARYQLLPGEGDDELVVPVHDPSAVYGIPALDLSGQESPK